MEKRSQLNLHGTEWIHFRQRRSDGATWTVPTPTRRCRPCTLRTCSRRTDWRQARPLMLVQQAPQLGVLGLEAHQLVIAHWTSPLSWSEYRHLTDLITSPPLTTS